MSNSEISIRHVKRSRNIIRESGSSTPTKITEEVKEDQWIN